MKKIYKKPMLSIQMFAVDSIMSGTGEEATATESNLLPLITDLEGGGTINLGDNNKLESINYNDFILK